MGNFHPHGDSAIYDALARMVQTFSLRHPLVDGHGAFGSPDPESQPAAARYTECKLAPIAMQLLDGIDEDTVEFTDSYDGKTREPVVLPSRFPNLLVNGSQGIAVGMATNIPPHNLGEVIDATIHLIDHPDATPDDLMEFVKGPDFPTGALILGRSRSAWTPTGPGAARSGCARSRRSRRARTATASSSPRSRTRRRSRASSARSPTSSTTARSKASAACATSRRRATRSSSSS